MKSIRIDASLVCFAVVMIAAIPVAALRAKTFGVGYDLGRLKETERNLRQKNVELQFELAATERAVRDKFLSKQGSDFGHLQLPSQKSIIYGNSAAQTNKESK